MKALLLLILFVLTSSTHAMMGKNEKQCDKIYKVKPKLVNVKDYFNMGLAMKMRRYRMKNYYLNCFFYKNKCISMEHNMDSDSSFSRLEAQKLISKLTSSNYKLPEKLKSTRLPRTAPKHEGKFLGKLDTYSIALRISSDKITGIFLHSDSNIAKAIEMEK